ncbi:hypothetical protein ScPMuIL_010111 [Solemya velum]
MFVPCANERICATYRIVYTTRFRKVVRMVPRTQKTYSCCPGWDSYNRRHNGCIKPLCSSSCENGGVCIRPDRCQCRAGWGGPQCQQDLDECQSVGTRCQHVCRNTPGSYYCQCHEGFQLQPDRISCKFCLTCIDEYRNLAFENQRLGSEIEDIINRNKKLDEDLGRLTEEIRQMQTLQGADATAVDPHAISEIKDLKTRIDGLEELIRHCYCSRDGSTAEPKNDKHTPSAYTKTDPTTPVWDYEAYPGNGSKEY